MWVNASLSLTTSNKLLREFAMQSDINREDLKERGISIYKSSRYYFYSKNHSN